MTRTRVPMALSLLLLLTPGGCSVLNWGGTETGVGGVEGIVTDNAGTGVRGATVTVMSADVPPVPLGSGTTNSRGEFQIDKIPAGRGLTVIVIKSYNTRTLKAQKTVRVGGGNVTDLGRMELRAGP